MQVINKLLTYVYKYEYRIVMKPCATFFILTVYWSKLDDRPTLYLVYNITQCLEVSSSTLYNDDVLLEYSTVAY